MVLAKKRPLRSNDVWALVRPELFGGAGGRRLTLRTAESQQPRRSPRAQVSRVEVSASLVRLPFLPIVCLADLEFVSFSQGEDAPRTHPARERSRRRSGFLTQARMPPFIFAS